MPNWVVAPYAFRPNRKRDIDGMSFFREDFSDPNEVAASNKHPAGAYVVRLRVSDLQGLGLTVQAAPDPGELPGHAVIPELKFLPSTASKEEKERIKILEVQLALLASQGIAHAALNSH